MKPRILFLLLVLVTPVAAQNNSTPTAPPSASPPKELGAHQQAFLNLPEERRKEFVKHVEEAHRVFQQQRVFEALDEIEKAAAIFKDSPEVHNLRGSCYVEMRSFDKALAEFQEAARLAPDNPNIEFNLGEVHFVTKEWQKALDLFEKAFKQLPQQGNNAMSRLTEFKIMLCQKKLGKDAEARKLAEKYDFMDDSPFYYYAQAALAYEANDVANAEDWLARAGRVFNDPKILAPWQDTLVEYGYIKSLFGADAPAEE